MKLKKIVSGCPLIGFTSSSLLVEMVDLHEAPLRTSSKQKITVNAVSMTAIHNGPPAAWRFLPVQGSRRMGPVPARQRSFKFQDDKKNTTAHTRPPNLRQTTKLQHF
jgi:hypothetical protein